MIKLTVDQVAEIVRMLDNYTEELNDRIDYTDEKDKTMIKYLEGELAETESVIADLKKILAGA